MYWIGYIVSYLLGLWVFHNNFSLGDDNYMNIKERKILLDAGSGVSITIDIDLHNPTKVCVLRWLCNIYYIHTYKHTHLYICIYRSYQWTVFDLEARYT